MATPLRRAIGLVLVAVLTVAILAACTGKKDRQEATPDSGSVATAPPDTEATDSTGPGATDDLPYTTETGVAPTTTAPVETTTTTTGPPVPGRPTTTRRATTTTTMPPYVS